MITVDMYLVMLCVNCSMRLSSVMFRSSTCFPSTSVTVQSVLRSSVRLHISKTTLRTSINFSCLCCLWLPVQKNKKNNINTLFTKCSPQKNVFFGSCFIYFPVFLLRWKIFGSRNLLVPLPQTDTITADKKHFQQTRNIYVTRSIWKMLGPFATASRRTP